MSTHSNGISAHNKLKAQPMEGTEPNRVDRPRSIRGWAAAAYLGLSLVALAIIFVVLADLKHLAVIDEGLTSTWQRYDDSFHRLSITGAFYFGAYLVGGILFIGFFHAAYSNLARFGARGLRFEVGQAIWPWFVPIFNCIRPKLIANDLWRASYGLDRAQPLAWREAPVSPLVHWWWGLYLITGLGFEFTRRAFIASLPASDGERLALQAQLVLLGLGLIALGLALALVHRVAKQQESLLRAE